MKKYSEEVILEKTLLLANSWKQQIIKQEIGEFQRKLKTIIESKENTHFLIRLLDSCFQSNDPVIISKTIEKIFTKQAIPKFFTFSEKSLIRLFLMIGKYFPDIAIPQIIHQVQNQTNTVIFIEQTELLKKHLEKRKEHQIKNNVNLIGEIVVGEREAIIKLHEYLSALKEPHITYLSIKLSNLYSQIHSISFDNAVQILIYRLSSLYKEAKENSYLENGQKVYKFINLDMEEYRDVELTVHTFIRTMEQPIFQDLKAGIVLQAYLPDALFWYQTLLLWAQERVKRGGAPIKIRIVKGANLAMEKIESSLNGWSIATYEKKEDTDSNYKKLLNIALCSENIQAVHIGIASHNLFDIAYAKTLIDLREIKEGYSFEMLEGMASQNLSLLKDNPIVLYTPIAQEEKFINAIGYLVRRLDEISDPQNFLSHSFHLEKSWDFLSQQFIHSFQNKDSVSTKVKRSINRQNESYLLEDTSFFRRKFYNDASTDFVLLSNRNWVKTIQREWKSSHYVIPLSPKKNRSFSMINSPSTNELIAQVEMTDEQDLNDAYVNAFQSEWSSYDFEKRFEILAKASLLFKKNRNQLLGVMASETGKTMLEGDAEVCEAIDFLEYYPLTLSTYSHTSKGVGVVISPWNFPVAIPLGGIVAGLSGGNTILFKPSSKAILCGYFICHYLWEAGIPRDALHFLPSSSAIFEKVILRERKIAFIIFTGSTEIALKINSLRKDVPLYAETGGKNVTIVTNHADKDLAIKDIIYSAFGHAGQKCSATSLVLLQKEIFEDEGFKNKLVDAVKSMCIGSVWELKNKIGPMVSPPNGVLEKAMKTIVADESWLIPPKVEQTNEHIVYPCIKWNVGPKNDFFDVELFGPLLSVKSFTKFSEAVDTVNAIGYGLTSGLESLDKDEIAYWKENLIAGNLYINRPTTGAIVQRQPFGGYRKSSIGAGIKAGGPNYALQFVNLEAPIYVNEKIPPKFQEFIREVKLHDVWQSSLDMKKISHVIKDYTNLYESHFSKQMDESNILGEHNVFLYRQFDKIIIRVTTNDEIMDILLCVIACQIIDCPFELNFETEGKAFEFFECYFPTITIRFDTDEEIIQQLNYEVRLRYVNTEIPESIIDFTSKNGYYISNGLPSPYGKIELMKYLKEQSVSHRYHRYGNLGV